MPYEFCKHPETGEVAAATGFKLRAGWKPCDAKGNTGEEAAPAPTAKVQRKKANKVEVRVEDYVSGQDVPPADAPSDVPSEPQSE